MRELPSKPDTPPTLRLNFPIVGIDIPSSWLRQAWNWVRRRPARRLEVLPRHGEMWLKSYCDGKASVLVTILHPGTTRSPVRQIDVERWSFDGTALPVQPFFIHVESRGDREFTDVILDLQLHESDINAIKGHVPPSTLDSDVAKSHGLPYRQVLEIRLRLKEKTGEDSRIYTLEVPNVVVHVAGQLSRTVANL